LRRRLQTDCRVLRELIFAGVVVGLGLVGCESQLSPYETAARDFSFDGVTFQCTENELRKMAEAEEAKRKYKRESGGVHVLNGEGFIALDSQSASHMHVSLKTGKVYEIKIWYYMDKLEELGCESDGQKVLISQLERESASERGVAIIQERIWKKFGKPKHEYKSSYSKDATWKFPRVGREVRFELTYRHGSPDQVEVIVADSVVTDKMERERQRAERERQKAEKEKKDRIKTGLE